MSIRDFALSGFADWWDTQHRDYKELLQAYVDENPSVIRSGVATLATIPTELGGGLVDALRFGQGFASGTPGGVATDVLRLLALAGPAGRISRYIGGSAASRVAIYLKDPAPNAGICTWVGVTKALRNSGAGTLFAKVEDLAQAAGQPISQAKPLGSLNSVFADEIVPAIRALGGKVKDLGYPRDLRHVMMTGQDLKPFQSLVFSAGWKMPNGNPAVHTFYLFKDGLGRLRISDRTGHVVKSLAEYEKLVPFWKGIANAEVFYTRGLGGAMLVLEGPQMVYLNHMENLAALMMPLVGLVAVNTEQVKSVAELDAHFQSFVAQKQGGSKAPATPPPPAAPGAPANLPPVEWLTGVQARLKHLGFYSGAVHGKHDAASKAAVIAFQQKNPPLRVDGIPGPKTQAKLKAVFGS